MVGATTLRKAYGGASSSMAVRDGGGRRKKKKSLVNEVVCRFPGQRSSPAASRYGLRNGKDPRFAEIEKMKKQRIEYWRSVAENQKNAKESGTCYDDSEDSDYYNDDDDRVRFEKILAEVDACHPRPRPLPDPSAPDDEILPKDVAERFKNMEENFERDIQRQDLKCARAALAYYNKTHKTKYKLTETLGSNCRVKVGVWYHCNFKAKLSPRSPCAADTSSKLFFAEIHRFDGFNVKACVILGEKNSRARCCDICSYQLAHPTEGFEGGR